MESVGALEDALEAAFALYDAEGEKSLRARYDIAFTRNFAVREGRRYDADILGRLVLAQADARLARSGWDSPASLVAATGQPVVAADRWSAAEERQWRMSVWDAVRNQTIDARWLRDRGVYGGMQGVWVDAARTRVLAPEGVAVAVRHTGRHYADDIDDRMAIYYYPQTTRPAARDWNEIEAVKNAGELHLPIFLIEEAVGGGRSVRLAWVVAADDHAGVFLFGFAEDEPRYLDMAEPETPFTVTTRRRRVAVQSERYERSPEFKFRVLRRHDGRCAVTGVGVPAVLDAAHVVPVEHGGSDDERNGLLLTATLHRAFDALLWAIEPQTLALRTRPRGPALADLRVGATSLRPGLRAPHLEALAWRWAHFKASSKAEQLDAALAAGS